jgi:hypothetical protein
MALTADPDIARVEAYVASIGSDAQVAIGNNILQVKAEHGAVVHVAMPEELPVPRVRPEPVHRLPVNFQDLLGREVEVEQGLAAVADSHPVNFHGTSGIGKTSLLHHLSHRVSEGPAPAVLFAPGRRQTVDDLMQFAFDELYETDKPMKATGAQLRHYLHERRGAFVFDDLELPREDVEVLLDAAPQASFVVSSAERLLWAEGAAVELPGLPLDAALTLVERELGRDLLPTERPIARSVCVALEGNPLHLLQAAAAVNKGQTLTDLVESQAKGRTSTPQVLVLPDEERRILALLTAAEGTPLNERVIALASGVVQPQDSLMSLIARGLVAAQSPRYRVTEVNPELLREPQELEDLGTHVVAAVADWSEETHSPEDVVGEVESILWASEWGDRHQRWDEVLRLQRATETALILGKRWGAWGALLDRAVVAAHAAKDSERLALALHQRGTRAGALDPEVADRSDLREAIRIREELADEVGAAVSRHNLRVLFGPSGGTGGKGGSGDPKPPPFPLKLVVAGALVAGAAIGGFSWWRASRPVTPPVQPSGASILITPSQMDFGLKVVGVAGSNQTIELTNMASVKISVSKVQVEGRNPDDFSIANDSCTGSPIPHGASCRVLLAFQPLALGERTALVRLSMAGDRGEALIPLVGEGSRPSLMVDSTTLNFGDVEIGGSSTKRIKATNQWTRPIIVGRTRIENSPGHTFKITENGCKAKIIEVDGSCTLKVTFAPRAIGERTASLGFYYHPGPGPPFHLTISGAGTKETPTPGSSVTPTPSGTVTPGPSTSPSGIIPCSGAPDLGGDTFSFGTIAAGDTSARTITVTNRGSGACSVADVIHEEPGCITHVCPLTFAVTGNQCYQSTLDPNESCVVDMTFTPPGVGSYSDTLAVVFASPGGEASAALTGVGSEPPDSTPPSIPTDLRWDEQSSCPQQMLWNASVDDVGVVGYDIYKNGASNAIASVSDTKFTDLGGDYFDSYTVDAYDATGNHSEQTLPLANPPNCG